LREVVTSCTALRPIGELRLRNDAFSENIVDLDCRYISDEKVMILKAAIMRPDRAELHAEKVGFLNKFRYFERFSAEDCEEAFSNIIARATEPAELLGCFTDGPYGSIGKWKKRPFYIAVAVTAATGVAFLNAEVVRLIDSLVGGFDGLKTYGACDAFAFFRQGRPVAILMPLRPKRVYLSDEIAAVAREHAQRLKENQDRDSHESRGTTRGAE